MAIHKHVKSQSKETIIFDIYQLNPTFYRKIISRSSSFRFTRQNSFKSYSGKVPFIWEIQPGTPRADDISSHETVKPIRFPPAIYSLTIPKPSIPPSGAKAFLVKNLRKMKNVHIQVPKIVIHKPNPNPNTTIKNMKVYFLKNLKKVEKIKNGMAKKAKPPVVPARAASADEKMNRSDSDGFESSYSDFDDFTPSYKTSGYSTPSMFESSSPRSFSFKSPTMMHFRNLPKGLLKWSFLKRDNGK